MLAHPSTVLGVTLRLSKGQGQSHRDDHFAIVIRGAEMTEASAPSLNVYGPSSTGTSWPASTE